MAIISSGRETNITATVDPSFSALRTASYPIDTIIGAWAIGGSTGAYAGAAAATSVFSFRYFGVNLILVRRVRIGWGTTTAFGANQPVDFSLVIGRNWTASDSGGTAIAILGNQNKKRTSLPSQPLIDCRISSTAALTNGTRTLDAQPMASCIGASLGLNTGLETQDLFTQDFSDYPLILGNNEGFIIRNEQALGATGVLKVGVNVEFYEVTSY